MQPLTLLLYLSGFAIVILGVLVLIVGVRSMTKNEVAERLHEYVDEPAAPAARRASTAAMRRQELSGSVASRVLLPSFKRLGSLFGRLTPTKTMENLNRQLTLAGNPLGLGGREFYGLRLVFLLLGFWLAFVFLRSGLSQMNLLMAIACLLVCGYLPPSWLRGRVRARQEKVRRGLPDALDMLSVCAEAGLGFDQSLQRISDHWKTPVGIEFGKVVKEMEMGISRQNALRSLAERMDITELSSFVAVIIQSDQLGMSIAETLHTQAKQMREERRFRAQEQARKIPLKMLFPMLLLIMPAMFAVILGPTLPAFRDMIDTLMVNIR